MKQTDFDGTISYFDITTVNCSSDNNANCIIYNVYSVGNIIAIDYSCTNYFGEFKVELINILGQNIFMDIEYVQNKDNHFEINTDEIAIGVYVLRLSNKNNIFQKKFIK